MFDKMKQLLDMQKKMQEMKRELEATYFESSSPDGLLKITMSGAQQVQAVVIQTDIRELEKGVLEKAIKDAYNSALKASHELAAKKMKDITGFTIPGLS